ncbi:MAG: CubicO group peptidase (beta-lactamase class C family) [Candidatus Azotimanducaceae bacterium]
MWITSYPQVVCGQRIKDKHIEARLGLCYIAPVKNLSKSRGSVVGASVEIQGHCDPRFGAVKEVLAASIESGTDIGASFAAYIHGEKVVDIWAGHLDVEQSTPWQENTLINVYSTTKTMSFLCAMLLVEQGRLDFDANVSDYWPEFAQNGKENVKVWHLMNHAAGLSGTDAPLQGEDLYDWAKVIAALEKQAPWWEPGSATGYHAISGKSIGRFFADEIAGPLQADFYIGVPEAEFPRIADLIPPGGDAALGQGGDSDTIASRTFRYPATTALTSRTAGWRTAEIPAANGHGNARSVAKIHSALANMGESQGIRLFSEDLAKQVMDVRIEGTDMALGVPMAFGLGFGVNTAKLLSPNPNTCFWGGWGGSLALIDQDAGMSMAYVMNKMDVGLTGDVRSYNLAQAMYAAL